MEGGLQSALMGGLKPALQEVGNHYELYSRNLDTEQSRRGGYKLSATMRGDRSQLYGQAGGLFRVREPA